MSGEDFRLPKTPEHPAPTDQDESDLKDAQRNSPRNPPREEADPDPAWVPDPSLADNWRASRKRLGGDRRPKREDIFPFLLIRAMSPGDRGQRPLWPPTCFWESHDILFIDSSWAGAYDENRVVETPRAGTSYRVFIRIWNLGLFPAYGVHVKAWVVQPGFIGTGNENDPYYAANFIGGQMVAELADRLREGCMLLAELDQLWVCEESKAGEHWCVLASVSCPADDFQGPLLANTERHVGQRNLSILSGDDDVSALVAHLAGLVPEKFTLEVTHGGSAVLSLLQGMSSPKFAGNVSAPSLADLMVGVRSGTGAHLMTAYSSDGLAIVTPSRALAGELRGLGLGIDEQEFVKAGAARGFLGRIGVDRLTQLEHVSKQSFADAVLNGMRSMLRVERLTAGAMAAGLGGGRSASHLLRFTLSEPEGEVVGGYSIIVS